jgi:hypothetical protein
MHTIFHKDSKGLTDHVRNVENKLIGEVAPMNLLDL